MPVCLDAAMRVSIKSDPAYLPRIRRIAACVAEHAGMDDQQQDEAALVLTEACVNAVRHGSPRGIDDQVMITLRSSDISLMADVTDSGMNLGLLSNNLRNSHNLGIKLMRFFSHSIKFIKRRTGLTVRIVMNVRRCRYDA